MEKTYTNEQLQLNNILSAYQEMNIAELHVKQELKLLVSDATKFVSQKIATGNKQVTVTRSNVWQVVNKPIGFDKMLLLIQTFKEQPTNLLLLKHIDFINGEIVINSF